MTTLLSALQTKDNVTENGMVTNSSSKNQCVNLFFTIATMRTKINTEIINAFIKAFNEDNLTALKILFWARDIRNGAGERNVFRVIIKYLAENEPDILLKNLHLIPSFGRWDDIFQLFDTSLESNSLSFIQTALLKGDGLCAKWMPRENSKNKKLYNKIRKYLKLSPKEFRKLVTNTSNTVEQLMCSSKWSDIDYSKIPSKAMSDYMKSFQRNDGIRFSEYLKSLKDNQTKINTGAIYPYDVIKNLKFGNRTGAALQWNSLPNFLESNNERILPLVDVSGSMEKNIGQNLTCMDVSISLGLYISERNKGNFKDYFITFSDKPELQLLSGNLEQRYSQLKSADWGMNTNLIDVFKLILNQATDLNVNEEEMPTTILIISDMEFDIAVSEDNWNDTAQEVIEKLYNRAGYKIPKIIYWNLDSKSSNFPVSFNQNGTALISGFSPTILKTILSGKDITPYNVMIETINSDRYSVITI